MDSDKTIYHDATAGEIRVTDIDPLYGEVDRPAGHFEKVIYKAKQVIGDLLQKST